MRRREDKVAGDEHPLATFVREPHGRRLDAFPGDLVHGRRGYRVRARDRKWKLWFWMRAVATTTTSLFRSRRLAGLGHSLDECVTRLRVDHDASVVVG